MLVRFGSLVVVVVVAGFVFLSEGCSKSTQRFGGKPDGQISEAFVRAMIAESWKPELKVVLDNQADTPLEDAGRVLNKAISRFAMTMAADMFGTCGAEYTGDKTDADGDKIWLNATAAVNCTSGLDKINANFTLRDENDALDLGKAGFFVGFTPSTANFGIGNSRRLDVQLEASEGTLKVTETEASASVTAAGKLATDKWSVSTGFEGSASYTGNIASRKDGDKASVTGLLLLHSTGVPQMPDVTFTASLTSNFTTITCPGRSAKFADGEAVLVDGEENTIRIVAQACKVSFQYNGKTLETRDY